MRKRLFTTLTTLFLICLCLFALTACGKPHSHEFNQQIATTSFYAKGGVCGEQSEYYYSCSCGEKGTKTFKYGEPLQHDYGNCTPNGDGTHTKICYRNTEHVLTENCTGGTATCLKKAVCLFCNSEYGQFGEHSHNTLKHNTTEHWLECACGDKEDIENHTYENKACVLCNTEQEDALYKVGLLSDIHIRHTSDSGNSQSDFANALNYFTEQSAKMVCVTGDLTDSSLNKQFEIYKEICDNAQIPVYETTGNHDAYPTSLSRDYTVSLTEETCIAYHIYDLIGKDLYYCLYGNTYEGLQITYNNGTFILSTRTIATNLNLPNGDVYIFVGILGEGSYVFFQEGMQWFKDKLEQFRNNRCFVFEHCRAERLHRDEETNVIDSDLYAEQVSGNMANAYLKPMWPSFGFSQKTGLVFESLMAHYTNCIWFHGHTHMSATMFNDYPNNTYIDGYFGDAYDKNNLSASENNTKFSWSVHLSSCSEPRVVVDGQITTKHSWSEGCVMTIYNNSVEIEYINLINKTLITKYILNTELDTIEANSYVDSFNYFN